MEDTHANPLYFHDATLPPLLQSEEIQRARKAGPYPRWVIMIPSMPETRKMKKARV